MTSGGFPTQPPLQLPPPPHGPLAGQSLRGLPTPGVLEGLEACRACREKASVPSPWREALEEQSPVNLRLWQPAAPGGRLCSSFRSSQGSP